MQGTPSHLPAMLCFCTFNHLQNEQEGGVLPVSDAGRGGHEGESMVHDMLYFLYVLAVRSSQTYGGNGGQIAVCSQRVAAVHAKGRVLPWLTAMCLCATCASPL